VDISNSTWKQFLTSKSRLNLVGDSVWSFLMSFEPACLSLTAWSFIAARGDGYLNIHFYFKFKAWFLYWSVYVLFHKSICILKEECLLWTFHSAPSVAAYFPIAEDTMSLFCPTQISYEISYNPPSPLHLNSACQ